MNPKNVRRVALGALTRPRLLEIAAEFDIDLYANTVRADALNAVSRKRSISLRDLLREFYRDELKIACQRLELDDSGREKALLINRILRAAKPKKATQPKKTETRRTVRSGKENRQTRSTGNSRFLDGAKKMDDPKVPGSRKLSAV